jgi:hypothetical protein
MLNYGVKNYYFRCFDADSLACLVEELFMNCGGPC